MSSANDHMPPPTKHRVSPLEFRNSDLVSRLLAATPPYLFNMSLLPNTYFFSEMLRSLVQAKAARTAHTFQPPMRRSRKRNWTASRLEHLQKPSNEGNAEDKPETADWMIKSNKKVEENPLELTITKSSDSPENKIDNFSPKTEPSSSDQVFPSLHHSYSPESSPQNLVLPPPPPIWYPPLYPGPPYNIDPLHFFIDLRVSGHVYDKKHSKEAMLPHSEGYNVSNSKDRLPHTEVSGVKSETDTNSASSHSSFKQTRHCSAFTVPLPKINSRNLNSTITSEREIRPTRFDVKSMGFDKNPNKNSTHYVMNNIKNIYKNIQNLAQEGSDYGSSKGDINEETAEDREKRMKDLRAMIGLELVVDYVKPKSSKKEETESSSCTDVESIGSPALEVVAINEEN